jgi:hypothetical protein
MINGNTPVADADEDIGVLTTLFPGKCSKLLATPYSPHVGNPVNHHQYPVIPDEIRMGKIHPMKSSLLCITKLHFLLNFQS